jgi:serine protease AprX
VLGLRVPNSLIDQAYPSARVGQRFFRGSGTSQATAVVSGAAALLLQKYPTLTPDQVKALLTSTATPLPKMVTWRSEGEGIVSVGAAQDVSAAGIAALPLPSRPSCATGTGSLDLARGSSHVVDGGVTLSGEKDIFGHAWDGSTWAPSTLAGTTWSGGNWNGSQWTGADWATAANWAAAPWLGTSWSGIPWTGRSWASRSWAGNGWDGRSWLDTTWTGRSWADSTWSSGSWS